jgi:hypothetical protein
MRIWCIKIGIVLVLHQMNISNRHINGIDFCYIEMLNGRPQKVISFHVEAFELIPPEMNAKAYPLTKEHTYYPCKFQQTVGRPNNQQ